MYYSVYDNSVPVFSENVKYFLKSTDGYLHQIKKLTIDKLGEPFNNCVKSVDSLENSLTKEIKSRDFDYTQIYCYKLCRLKFLEKICNCSLEYQLWTKGNDTCDEICLQNNIKTFSYEENCEKACPLECDSNEYDMQIEITDSQDKQVIIENKNLTEKFSNYTAEQLMQNVSVLNFNFENMQYTEIKEVPRKTFDMLIAEIGGIAGINQIRFNLILLCHLIFLFFLRSIPRIKFHKFYRDF